MPMLGSFPIGQTPVSSRAALLPYIPPTPYDALIANPALERIYLLELTIENAAGADVDLQFSSHGYRTTSDFFPPVLENPLNFGIKLFESSFLTGPSKFGSGSIKLTNCDCALDGYLKDASWSKYDFTVKMGAMDFAYEDFVPIFIGRIESINWDERFVNLRIRDNQVLLNDLLQHNTYAGTGGVEGTADIAGKPKPLCLGACYNIEPVLVDPTTSLYQIHSGAIQSVDAVYFAGLLASAGTDYTVNVAAGTITLLTNPLGTVTCDVRGSSAFGGYVNSVADITERVCVDYGPLTSANINTGAFQALNEANSSAVGFYSGLNPTSISAVVDTLLNSIGGFWGFDRFNKLRVGIVEEPTAAVKTITTEEIIKIARITTPVPTHLSRVGYQKNWTVMNADRLAGAVSETAKSFFQQEYRFAEDSDAAVETKHPINNEREILSLLAGESDATDEVTRIQALFGEDRDIYRVKCRNISHDITIGDVIQVVHDRFELTTGQKFVVIGFTENVKQDNLDLLLWG